MTGLISFVVLPILLGPAAIVLGAIGWAKASDGNGIGRGAATTGVVLDVLALVARNRDTTGNSIIANNLSQDQR